MHLLSSTTMVGSVRAKRRLGERLVGLAHRATQRIALADISIVVRVWCGTLLGMVFSTGYRWTQRSSVQVGG
jgi:hypothetical protein